MPIVLKNCSFVIQCIWTHLAHLHSFFSQGIRWSCSSCIETGTNETASTKVYRNVKSCCTIQNNNSMHSNTHTHSLTSTHTHSVYAKWMKGETTKSKTKQNNQTTDLIFATRKIVKRKSTASKAKETKKEGENT